MRGAERRGAKSTPNAGPRKGYLVGSPASRASLFVEVLCNSIFVRVDESVSLARLVSLSSDEHLYQDGRAGVEFL
jgi:hypothetical protein